MANGKRWWAWCKVPLGEGKHRTEKEYGFITAIEAAKWRDDRVREHGLRDQTLNYAASSEKEAGWGKCVASICHVSQLNFDISVANIKKMGCNKIDLLCIKIINDVKPFLLVRSIAMLVFIRWCYMG
jgi:hypothetical protein